MFEIKVKRIEQKNKITKITRRVLENLDLFWLIIY